MAEIIQFPARDREAHGYPTFKKQVDGITFECVDVDSLTPAQRDRFFARAESAEDYPADS